MTQYRAKYRWVYIGRYNDIIKSYSAPAHASKPFAMDSADVDFENENTHSIIMGFFFLISKKIINSCFFTKKNVSSFVNGRTICTHIHKFKFRCDTPLCTLEPYTVVFR